MRHVQPDNQSHLRQKLFSRDASLFQNHLERSRFKRFVLRYNDRSSSPSQNSVRSCLALHNITEPLQCLGDLGPAQVFKGVSPQRQNRVFRKLKPDLRGLVGRVEVRGHRVDDHRIQFIQRIPLSRDAAFSRCIIPPSDKAPRFMARFDAKGDFSHLGLLCSRRNQHEGESSNSLTDRTRYPYHKKAVL